ncbi:MAG: hypothetical protein VX815_14670 [Gemmatimonadota bacterium]|nr:hypothetical protein [Gemmatimonadota bacterium]
MLWRPEGGCNTAGQYLERRMNGCPARILHSHTGATKIVADAGFGLPAYWIS